MSGYTTDKAATGNVLPLNDAPARIASIVAFIAVAFAIVWFRNLDSQGAGAFNGWSPTLLMTSFWSDPLFVSRNYPGGEEELLKSAIYLPLPLIGAMGVSKSVVFPLLVALEVFALAGAAIFAVRRLVGRATVAEAILTAMLLVAGTLASGNLARWGHPYYGSVYNSAYGAGLVGAALVLTENIKRGSFFLGLSYVIHPVLGLFFGVFAMAAILADVARFRWRELGAGALIFSAMSALWTFYSMRNADISGVAIPANEFIIFTKMMGYHWYPVSHGIFGLIAYERFVPFLSTCLLIVLFLFQSRPLVVIERRIIAGIAALGIVTLFGILAAELSNMPFLIKLALHRASAVLLLVGSLFVVPGLLRMLAGDSWWLAVPAAAIIASVLADPYGPLLLPSVLLASLVVIELYRQGRSPHPVLLASLAAVLASITWLIVAGHLRSMPGTYFGLHTVSRPLFLAVLAALLLLRAWRSLKLAPVAIGVACCIWAASLAPLPNANLRAKAAAYLEVQRWAKANSQQGALFMVDPGHAYGWREYSERPSFGNVREWLYAGWIYNSRRAVYDRGLEYLSFFGIAKEELVRRQAEYPDYGKIKLAGDLQKFYYGADIGWFKTAVDRYGVDYFVMDETMAKEIGGLETVYRNEAYSVRRVASPQTRP